MLAQVKAAGQYPILAEVILEHAGVLGVSLTAYHGLNQSQQAQVFRLMMGDARLNAFSTIKPLFEECVQKAGQQKEPSSGGNGGGGSISGSGQVPSCLLYTSRCV